MQQLVGAWWKIAKEEFAKIAPTPIKEDEEKIKNAVRESMASFLSMNGEKLPEVRGILITTLKESLLEKKVLDEFQVAGVFVNWWTNIKYDLKTIATIGWVPSLVPREYFIETYFKAEQQAIQQTENLINEKEAALQEAIEAVEYETEEGEVVTAKQIKTYLKTSIEDMQPTESNKPELATAIDEITKFAEQLNTITSLEKQVKDAGDQLKKQQVDLNRKIEYKMYGVEDAKAETLALITQCHKQMSAMQAVGEPTDKKGKAAYQKQLKKLQEDLAKMQQHNAGLEKFLAAIGGVITPEECKTLILQKHNSLVQEELMKYLNAEKRKLVAGLEKLWDKYAVPSQTLETERQQTLDKLNGFLTELNYLN